jgi:MoxR-like ATPase
VRFILLSGYNSYSARRRGYDGSSNLTFPEAQDQARKYESSGKKPASGSVLLIDEIDKADIDFPNNLLVALGSRQFSLEEIAKTISINTAKNSSHPLGQPLVIITSNQQRPLPDTFVRRCVVLEIEEPTSKELIDLAIATYGSKSEALYKTVADHFDELKNSGKIHFNAAEYLDAIQALKELKIDPNKKTVVEKVIWNISWRSSESY